MHAQQTNTDCDVDQTSELELRDAVIKLVRLMANLSIHYEVGLAMGSDRENLQVRFHLIHTIDSFVDFLYIVVVVGPPQHYGPQHRAGGTTLERCCRFHKLDILYMPGKCL